MRNAGILHVSDALEGWPAAEEVQAAVSAEEGAVGMMSPQAYNFDVENYFPMPRGRSPLVVGE
jgi:hypothetical protein